jgi:hypothetical protein
MLHTTAASYPRQPQGNRLQHTSGWRALWPCHLALHQPQQHRPGQNPEIKIQHDQLSQDVGSMLIPAVAAQQWAAYLLLHNSKHLCAQSASWSSHGRSPGLLH